MQGRFTVSRPGFSQRGGGLAATGSSAHMILNSNTWKGVFDCVATFEAPTDPLRLHVYNMGPNFPIKVKSRWIFIHVNVEDGPSSPHLQNWFKSLPWSARLSRSVPKLKGFCWPVPHPPTKFLWNPSSSFYLIRHTNKAKDRAENILSRGINFSFSLSINIC